MPPSAFWVRAKVVVLAFPAASFRGPLAVSVCVWLGAGAGCGKSTSQASRALPPGEAGVAGEAFAGAPSDGGRAPSDGGGKLSDAGSPSAIGGGDSGAAAGAAAAAGDAGAGGDAPAPLPPGLLLRAISISQTEELPLMLAGEAVAPARRPAPLIAGKHALVRAFVDVDAGFVGRKLLGVLDLKTAQVTRTWVSERDVTASSQQDDLTSSFVFNVDAADLAATSTYRVRVLEADATPLARFPNDGYLALDAKVLPPFKLVVVPFISNGFGPRLGDAELNALRHRLVALYPSTDVEISLAAPVTLPYIVNADGDGWDNALDRIYQLRAAATPAPDVFYYGAMAPDDSYATYCTEACVLGFSRIAEETDVASRGSIGITVFQDGSGSQDAWDTVAHELGHAMGRDHAPCGIADPTDVDAAYPYDNAGLGGVYGYDFDRMRLVKPRPAKDVMSYCTPVWISDYTYRAIYDRLDYIASESFRALAFVPPALFRLARIRRTGESVWLGEARRQATARRAQLDLLDDAGQRVGSVEAQLVLLDHAPGGYVWLPALELAQSGPNAASVDLRPLGGAVLRL